MFSKKNKTVGTYVEETLKNFDLRVEKNLFIDNSYEATLPKKTYHNWVFVKNDKGVHAEKVYLTFKKRRRAEVQTKQNKIIPPVFKKKLYW